MNETTHISLEKILLETLSFYRSYTLSEILLELDKETIEGLPHFTFEDLNQQLDKLTQAKKLEMIMRQGEKSWKRILYKKQPWWDLPMKFFSRLNTFFKFH